MTLARTGIPPQQAHINFVNRNAIHVLCIHYYTKLITARSMSRWWYPAVMRSFITVASEPVVEISKKKIKTQGPAATANRVHVHHCHLFLNLARTTVISAWDHANVGLPSLLHLLPPSPHARLPGTMRSHSAHQICHRVGPLMWRRASVA